MADITGFKLNNGSLGPYLNLKNATYDALEPVYAGNVTVYYVNSNGDTVTTTVSGTYYVASTGDVVFVPSSSFPQNLVYITLDDATRDYLNSIPKGDASNNAFNGSNNPDYYWDGRGVEQASGGGNDTINTYGGNDRVFSGKGHDTINAGTGNDFVRAGGGNDRVVAGDGDDTVYGGAGQDTIFGGAGNDSIYGGAGQDSIDGGAGNDVIDAHTGGEKEYFSWTNFDQSGAQQDISGGFTQNTGSMNVTFTQKNDGFLQETKTYVGDDARSISPLYTENGEPYDPYSAVFIRGQGGENVSTSTLTFDAQDGSGLQDNVSNVNFRINDIDTGAFTDQVIIRAYDANGNPVHVDLTGASGHIVTDGTTATVTANNPGTTQSSGTGSVKVEIAGPVSRIEIEFNQVSGTGDQNAIYITDVHFETLPDTTIGDTVEGGLGQDTIYAGAGADWISGGDDADLIYAGDGADTIYGGAGNDRIFYGEGADTVYGGDGDDTIDDVGGYAHNTASTIYAGAGNDLVYGTSGGDSIDGGSGNDNIFGEVGADSITGGAGNDYIDGGSQNDTLDGGTGDDRVYGGDGSDVFRLSDNFGHDTIVGGEGAEVDFGDVIDATGLSNGVTVDFSAPETGIITDGTNDANFSEIEALLLGAGDDTVYGSDGADYVSTGAGSDYVDGGAGDDIFELGNTLTGVADNSSDTIYFADGDGHDLIYGFASPQLQPDGTYYAQDKIDVSGMHDTNGNPVNIWDVTVEDYGGNARLLFPNGESLTLYGVSPATMQDPVALLAVGIPDTDGTIEGSDGADVIDFGYTGDPDGDRVDHDDNFKGGERNADTIEAKGGDDTIYAGDGDDVVYGGTGADTIYGGMGADTLYGNADDDDIFVGAGDEAYGQRGNDDFYVTDTGDDPADIHIYGGSEDDDGDGDTLYLGDMADMSTLVRNQNPDGSYSGSVQLKNGSTLTYDNIENIICFTPGTMILTPFGARAIETLEQGDLVITRDNGIQPIRWIQHRTVPAFDNFAPIRISKHALPTLDRDLLVSPQHRMLLDGYQTEIHFGEDEVLVAAKHMIDDAHVTVQQGGFVTYFHMMFDKHEIVYANGAASESFHPGEIGLSAVTDAAREELFGLFPELRASPDAYGDTARRCLKRHEAQLLMPAKPKLSAGIYAA